LDPQIPKAGDDRPGCNSNQGLLKGKVMLFLRAIYSGICCTSRNYGLVDINLSLTVLTDLPPRH